MDYLIAQNAKGELPILFTSIGKWWGTNPATRNQVEIDLVAGLVNVNGVMRSLIWLCFMNCRKRQISFIKSEQIHGLCFFQNPV